MANALQSYVSERPAVDAAATASPRVHSPNGAAGRSGDTAEQAVDRYLEAYWRSDVTRRHLELPCLAGACNADAGTVCWRHQRTRELVRRYIRAQHRRHAQLAAERRARRALELRLERHHQGLPCHRQDDPCSEERTCWRHRETDRYVADVLERFERLRARRPIG